MKEEGGEPRQGKEEEDEKEVTQTPSGTTPPRTPALMKELIQKGSQGGPDLLVPSKHGTKSTS